MALRLLEDARRKNAPFQIILSDFHMPRINGFELIERMRNAHLSSSAIIAMLTPAGHRDDAVRCRGLGVTAYLLKAVRQLELRQTIASALGVQNDRERVQVTTCSAPVSTVNPRVSLSILVAEDIP